MKNLDNKNPGEFEFIIKNFRKLSVQNEWVIKMIIFTAIPYRARTGPEQGFPCVVILKGKNLFS